MLPQTGEEGEYLPHVFTEQGIAMLSAVLVYLRNTGEHPYHDGICGNEKVFTNNAVLFERIHEMDWRQQEYEKKTDERFEKVFDYIAEHNEVRQKIFFEGQIYDAFSLLVELVGSAEKSIILIDNYVDVNTLNILAKEEKEMSMPVSVQLSRLN